ncbi:MAG: YbbC/YhhH family protein [Prevotella sp.]|nr:YbbC/YhhH family protein [Prevotella sp.]MDE6151471.1 YbbC/YhhH family protein [Prevotella sp.]
MRRLIMCIITGIIIAVGCIKFSTSETEYKTVNLESMADYYIENDSIKYEHNPYIYDINTKSRELHDGLVRDETTAVEISKIVFRVISVEGNEVSYVPYRVSLSGDSMWIVKGAIPGAFNGGDVYVEIRKQDGCVLRIIEEK